MKNRCFFPGSGFIAAAFFLFVRSCNPGHTDRQGLRSEIMDAEKPAIDTSRILETLELYRAKRYEGLEDALTAGADQASKLVLNGRKMGTLAPEIGRLTYLQSLDVAFNDLKELPAEISNLHYLQGFYANGNSLQAFPSQILLLPLLEKLDLSQNQITVIPPEIMKMDQLIRFSMDENALTSIPVQLFHLKNLEILELKGNGLRIIPAGVSNLHRLKKLDLANNQLKILPREITTLSSSLEELNIQGNHISREEIEWLINSLPETRVRF